MNPQDPSFDDDSANGAAHFKNTPSAGGTQDDDATGAQQGNGTGASLGSEDELVKLQEDLANSQQRIADLTDTSKRALADLTNYRRLVEQERMQYTAFANMNFIKEILPIADNFSRAFTHVPAEISGTEWYKGMVQIANQMNAFLKKQGVVEIPTMVGMPLDPAIHEPLLTGPGPKDYVIEEFEKGYMMGGQLLRPAKVKVGSGE